MVNWINLIIEMSPRFILGRENVPCVAEVVNRSLKADCTNFTKRLVLPIVLCLSDASLVIADNCNALGLIPPPAQRSVSACLISYVNYRGTSTCKVSNLSLFVTQFRSGVSRFESSTGILFISVILVSKS